VDSSYRRPQAKSR